MNALILFVSTWALVLFLGLQSLNVNGGHRLLACLTSFGIGAANLTVLSYSLDVFDRWGNMVFRTEQSEADWDGVFRARLSDGDVYPWLLRARVLYCGREISIFQRGDVTVVR